MDKQHKSRKGHILIIGFLIFPIICSTVLSWQYRNINDSHCSRYNLSQTLDYDLEGCQINGINLVITSDGSAAMLGFLFTYSQDIEAAISDPETAEDLYSFYDWYPPYEEGIISIGQYDFDEAIEIIVSSHPLMTYPGMHGSSFLQIDRYGSVEEENSIWTQLFMSYVTQFSAWWSYIGFILYIAALFLYKTASYLLCRTKKTQ